MADDLVVMNEDGAPKSKSRRRFLKAAGIVGGGLIIGIPLMRGSPGPWPHEHSEAFTPNAFLQITPNGDVHFYVPATEMGQGVNTKMLQIAAQMFAISPSRVKLESTNTTRVANTSPTAASATADLNGKALQKACNELITRLKECASRHLDCSADEITLFDGTGVGLQDLAVAAAAVERAAAQGTAVEVAF